MHLYFSGISISNLELAVFIIIISFVGIVIIGAIIELLYFFLQKKQNETIEFNTSHTIIYTMNLKSDIVTYFDKSNMAKQIVITADAFYSSFTENDEANKVRKWIDDFTKSRKGVDSFIPVTSNISHSSKNYMAILRITSYNVKQGILHFEKIYLPKIKNARSKSGQQSFRYVMPLAEVESILASKKYKSRSVNVIVIKIIPFTSEVNLEASNSITSIYQPVNSIYKFLNKERILTFLNDEEAVVFDFKKVQKGFNQNDHISILCQNILVELQRFCNTKSINNLYDASIGVAYYVPTSNRSLKEAVNEASKLAGQTIDEDSMKRIVIEGEISSISDSQEAIVKADIKKIIKNKTFSLEYTPILSLELRKNYYLVSLNQYGSNFSNFDELLMQADKFNYLRPLYISVLNYALQSITKNKSQKLILECSYDYIDSLVLALKKVSSIKSNIVISFSFSEIHNYYQIDSDIENKLTPLKEMGIKTMLVFDNTPSEWLKELVNLFDIYMFSPLSNQALHTSERDSSYLVLALNSVKEFQKPIIVNNLASQSDIEYAYELGYRSFVCPSLAPKNSVLYVPDGFWKKPFEPDNN